MRRCPSAGALLAMVGLGGMLAGFLSYRPSREGRCRPPAAAGGESGGAPDRRGGGGGAAVHPRDRCRALPDISFPDPAGVRFAAQLPGAPLIVNFWATWCAPCRREMPLLGQLRRRYRSDRLEVVGVAVDFGQAVRAFLTPPPSPIRS